MRGACPYPQPQRFPPRHVTNFYPPQDLQYRAPVPGFPQNNLQPQQAFPTQVEPRYGPPHGARPPFQPPGAPVQYIPPQQRPPEPGCYAIPPGPPSIGAQYAQAGAPWPGAQAEVRFHMARPNAPPQPGYYPGPAAPMAAGPMYSAQIPVGGQVAGPGQYGFTGQVAPAAPGGMANVPPSDPNFSENQPALGNQMQQLFDAIANADHEDQFEAYLNKWEAYYTAYLEQCRATYDAASFEQCNQQFRSYLDYLAQFRTALGQKKAARIAAELAVAAAQPPPPPPPPLPSAPGAPVTRLQKPEPQFLRASMVRPEGPPTGQAGIRPVMEAHVRVPAPSSQQTSPAGFQSGQRPQFQPRGPADQKSPAPAQSGGTPGENRFSASTISPRGPAANQSFPQQSTDRQFAQRGSLPEPPRQSGPPQQQALPPHGGQQQRSMLEPQPPSRQQNQSASQKPLQPLPPHGTAAPNRLAFGDLAPSNGQPPNNSKSVPNVDHDFASDDYGFGDASNGWEEENVRDGNNNPRQQDNFRSGENRPFSSQQGPPDYRRERNDYGQGPEDAVDMRDADREEEEWRRSRHEKPNFPDHRDNLSNKQHEQERLFEELKKIKDFLPPRQQYSPSPFSPSHGGHVSHQFPPEQGQFDQQQYGSRDGPPRQPPVQARNRSFGHQDGPPPPAQRGRGGKGRKRDRESGMEVQPPNSAFPRPLGSDPGLDIREHLSRSRQQPDHSGQPGRDREFDPFGGKRGNFNDRAMPHDFGQRPRSGNSDHRAPPGGLENQSQPCPFDNRPQPGNFESRPPGGGFRERDIPPGQFSTDFRGPPTAFGSNAHFGFGQPHAPGPRAAAPIPTMGGPAGGAYGEQFRGQFPNREEYREPFQQAPSLHLQPPNAGRSEKAGQNQLAPEVVSKVGHARRMMEALNKDGPIHTSEILSIIKSVPTESLVNQSASQQWTPSVQSELASLLRQIQRILAPAAAPVREPEEKGQPIQRLVSQQSRPSPVNAIQSNGSRTAPAGSPAKQLFRGIEVPTTSGCGPAVPETRPAPPPAAKPALQTPAEARAAHLAALNHGQSQPEARAQSKLFKDALTNAPASTESPNRNMSQMRQEESVKVPSAGYPAKPVAGPSTPQINGDVMNELGMNANQVMEAMERVKTLFGSTMGPEQSDKLMELLRSTVLKAPPAGAAAPPAQNSQPKPSVLLTTPMAPQQPIGQPIQRIMQTVPPIQPPFQTMQPGPRPLPMQYRPPSPPRFNARPPSLERDHHARSREREFRSRSRERSYDRRRDRSADRYHRRSRTPDRRNRSRSRSPMRRHDRSWDRSSTPPTTPPPPADRRLGFFAKALQQRGHPLAPPEGPQGPLVPPGLMRPHGVDSGSHRSGDRPSQQGAGSELRCSLTPLEDLVPRQANAPKKLAILLRGPPGSGKSWVAKKIKEVEPTTRILSIDDYFEVERLDDSNGKDRHSSKKVGTYIYEEKLEGKYRLELEKLFRKKTEDPYCTCLVVDSCHEKLAYFMDMVMIATRNGFDVFIGELPLMKPYELERRSMHFRSASDIAEIVRNWEPTPSSLFRVDLRKIIAEMPILTPERPSDLPQRVSLKFSGWKAPSKSKWDVDDEDDREEDVKITIKGTEWVEKDAVTEMKKSAKAVDWVEKSSPSDKKTADVKPDSTGKPVTTAKERNYRSRSRSPSASTGKKKR